MDKKAGMAYKRTRRILPLRNFNELLDVPDFFRLQGGSK